MLATVDDLVALGAVPRDWELWEVEARAQRLLEMAQALALDFLGLEEATVVADWTESRRTRLITWIAEKASTRLNVSAASSVNPYATDSGPLSMKLNRWEKEDLREIGRKTGLAVVDTTRCHAVLDPIEEYDPFLAGWPG